MSAGSCVPRVIGLADTLPCFVPQPSRGKRNIVDAYGCTRVGRVRERNEDQFLIAKLSRHTELECTSLPADMSLRMWAGTEGRLIAVADGMGGHDSGDVASTVVLQTMVEHIVHNVPWPGSIESSVDQVVLKELARGLTTCQERLERLAAKNHCDERRKPGTTLTLAYVVWPSLYLLHVGDSRCYLYRRPELIRLTNDHTLAQMLIDRDGLDRDVTMSSPLAHVLLQAVSGTDQHLEPEYEMLQLCPGDVILLCSDGLTTELDDEKIAAMLSSCTSARECSQRLVDAANQVGGRDNITAVVARF
jgi:PPM family protein phosphatase